MEEGLRESVMERVGRYGSPYFLESEKSVNGFCLEYPALANGYFFDDPKPPVVTVLGAKRFLLDLEDDGTESEQQKKQISALLNHDGCTLSKLARMVLEKKLEQD